MMTHEEYVTIREVYREMALHAEEIIDIERAEYLTGVIRGLDLAFQHEYKIAKN
jgi:hypothetical protein